MTNVNALFNWQRHPEAEALVLETLKSSLKNSFLRELKESLSKHCSTGLIEWVDHVAVSDKKKLESVGYKELYIENGISVYHHPGAQLPEIVLQNEPLVAISVDSIADFLLVRGMNAEIEGSPFSGYRRAVLSKDLIVVERRGIQTLDPITESAHDLTNYFLAEELWKTRSRASNEEKDLALAEEAVSKIVILIGQDRAACLILACERQYWQTRNTTGQIQKNRQDRLGMGWANHDHHTFRSSRKHFSRLVQLFEKLGFACRERYYTGEEAGWGAQIMENPKASLVLFLDVDLLPGEIAINFAHDTLPQADKLGTIGLWCALHGDSILKAGMHHLEAQFHFDDLKEDLKNRGINIMAPFSDFPYLKQAFTQGEMWPVDQKRIDTLLKEGKITQAQADKFSRDGALGSHLENLQRKEGYKGFNQKNVSIIIEATDPRKG